MKRVVQWRGIEHHPRVLTRAILMSMLFVGAARAAPADPDAPAPLQDEAARSREARDRYAAGDFVGSARAYEALQRSSGAAKYLFNAGMAREAAGQRAHALVHWRRYLTLAVGVPADESARLRAQVAAAEQATTPVRLVGADAEQTWTLRQGPDERDALAIAVAGATEVRLDPGAWTASREGVNVDFTVAREPVVVELPKPVIAVPVAPPPEVGAPIAPAPRTVRLILSPRAVLRRGVEISSPDQAKKVIRADPAVSVPGSDHLTVALFARGYLRRDVELGPDTPATLAIRFTRDPIHRARVGLTAGFGAAGLAATIAGVALAVDGGRTYRGAGDLSDETGVSRALAATGRQSAGLGTLGAGVGAIAAAASSWGSRRLWALEVGVGAAATIAGAALLGVSQRRYGRDAADEVAADPAWVPDRGFVDAHRRGELAGAVIVGAGVGLLVGAATDWLAIGALRRGARGRGAAWVPAGAIAGVGWSGRF